MGRIKNYIFYSLFKKEIEEIRSDFSRRFNNYCRRKDIECEKKTEMYALMTRALEDKNIIIGIEKNEADEEVIVTRNKYDFWLYGHSYEAFNRHPRILASQVYNINEDRIIKIEDILVEDNCRGNGSILMRYFIDFCKDHGFTKIVGSLSPVDKDHFDRSEHFYVKHGFSVEFNDDRSSGYIELEL